MTYTEYRKHTDGARATSPTTPATRSRQFATGSEQWLLMRASRLS
jgi:hypothetical protein